MTKTNINWNEKYFCARPKLASYLIGKGFTATQVINPFDEKYNMAWTFERTEELEASVNEYFRGGNK